MKASWNGATIAASDDTVVVEGNHYFPISAALQPLLEESNTHTHCPWKGVASYYHVVVDGKRNEDAAWWYPEPKPEAEQIRDRIAFWKGVDVKP